jgi:6-phosphogluconate dehydrogenase (decarboxylating)
MLMAVQHDPAAQHDAVGMVGTGNMGGRITRRMVEAGHDVLAVDADAARIPACGAAPAKDVAELAERCDVIMLSLPDSPVIESVIRNPGTGPGTLTAFQVSNALGYGDLISNRVVDALGDLAGGVRVSAQP